MSMVQVTSAKEKRRPPGPQNGPKKAGAGLTIRASAGWRAWLEKGAEHYRTDVSKLIDAAVIANSRAQGFTEAPPKR